MPSSPYRPLPTWAADAHPLAHVGERLGGDRRGARGAVGEDRLERVLVGAQLLVALAHRRQVLDDGRRDGGLEVAVARLGELGLDRRRV